MKKFNVTVSMILILAMLFSTTAFAEEVAVSDGVNKDVLVSPAVEVAEPYLTQDSKLQIAPKKESFSNNSEIIDYILHGPKCFTSGEVTLTVEELLSKSQVKQYTKSGDVSGTFTSARFDTGTPGVTWDYVVNYTISPMPSGIGWYFKSVSCNVRAFKEFLFYTWATVGILNFTKATYSLAPSTRPTSITVNMTLNYQIWTDATGPNPIVYSEDHSHTTQISNVYNS